jgi:hypothetical protein
MISWGGVFLQEKSSIKPVIDRLLNNIKRFSMENIFGGAKKLFCKKHGSNKRLNCLDLPFLNF